MARRLGVQHVANLGGGATWRREFESRIASSTQSAVSNIAARKSSVRFGHSSLNTTEVRRIESRRWLIRAAKCPLVGQSPPEMQAVVKCSPGSPPRTLHEHGEDCRTPRRASFTIFESAVQSSASLLRERRSGADWGHLVPRTKQLCQGSLKS